MRRIIVPLLIIAAVVSTACGDSTLRSASVGADGAPAAADTAVRPPAGATPVLQGTLPDIDGKQQQLAAYLGKVVLVVNTASRCGYTPQFDGLQALYKDHGGEGFIVLGFPSNDFKQELADDAQVKEFCSLDYGVTFPMFSRSAVTGASANTLFAALATQPAGVGSAPEWNFTKYLLDRRGVPVARYAASVPPDDPALVGTLRALLRQPA